MAEEIALSPCLMYVFMKRKEGVIMRHFLIIALLLAFPVICSAQTTWMVIVRPGTYGS